MNLSTSSVCNLCGRGDQLYRCTRCRTAVYCSKEHQRQHWKFHRSVCITPQSEIEPKLDDGAVKETTIINGDGYIPATSETNSHLGKKTFETLSRDNTIRNVSTFSDPVNYKSSSIQVPSENEFQNSLLTQQTAESTINFIEESPGDLHLNSDGLNSYEERTTNFESTILDMGSVSLASECSLRPETRWQSTLESISIKQQTNPPFLHRSFNRDLSSKQQLQRSSMEWMTQICQYVVRDLEKYGICVVDNFMGKERAESIHRSVVSMYHSGVFVEGETVSPSQETTKNVRSDKIAWVDGTEKNCADIAYLISTVDTIIMSSIRMKGNGQLGQRTIGGRTKVLSCCFLIKTKDLKCVIYIVESS